MKILALSALALVLASPSYAAFPATESAIVARLLIHSPAVAEQLQKNYTDRLFDLTSSEVKPGVTRYVLKFSRNCECIPATAIATIQEDMTPTYRDGAPVYESSVEIKNNNQ